MGRIGDRTDNLSFQAPSGSPVVWTTIFSCKGKHKGLTGQEKIAALASGSTITGTVDIPYRPVKIRPTWRILKESVTILSIIGAPVDTKRPEGRVWVMRVMEAV
jgi:SPP1 family predicted phage head-tail adaptor